MKDSSSVAYGALGLKPWEFGQLTIDEFAQMVDGYIWRTKQQQLSTAGFVAAIINTCTSRDLKKAVTVEMLLGIEAETKEKAKTDMTDLLARVG